MAAKGNLPRKYPDSDTKATAAALEEEESSALELEKDVTAAPRVKEHDIESSEDDIAIDGETHAASGTTGESSAAIADEAGALRRGSSGLAYPEGVTGPKKVRLKLHHGEGIRSVGVRSGDTFQQLTRRLQEDYGFQVELSYRDGDSDEILLQNQNDLNELIENESGAVSVTVARARIYMPPTTSSTAPASGASTGSTRSRRGPPPPLQVTGAAAAYVPPPFPQAEQAELMRNRPGLGLTRALSDCHLNAELQSPYPGGRRLSCRNKKTYGDGSLPLRRWKRGEEIGRGAYGVVYMGLNLDTGEIMAVKVVHTDGLSPKEVDAFENEINVLRHTSHRNIVKYYGVEKTETSLSVFLEYVPGGSVLRVLSSVGSFSEQVIRLYSRQLLMGLEFLHRNGLAHRDIKAANALVHNDGSIKLTDFGLSKSVRGQAGMSTSEADGQSVKGTAFWMAPEILQKVKLSFQGWQKADVWSVGCTIVEMATGLPPWSHLKPMTALFKLSCTEEMPELPSHLSGAAKSFLQLCFRRDPSLRPDVKTLLRHPWLALLSTPSDAIGVDSDTGGGGDYGSWDHWGHEHNEYQEYASDREGEADNEADVAGNRNISDVSNDNLLDDGMLGEDAMGSFDDIGPGSSFPMGPPEAFPYEPPHRVTPQAAGSGKAKAAGTPGGRRTGGGTGARQSVFFQQPSPQSGGGGGGASRPALVPAAGAMVMPRGRGRGRPIPRLVVADEASGGIPIAGLDPQRSASLSTNSTPSMAAGASENFPEPSQGPVLEISVDTVGSGFNYNPESWVGAATSPGPRAAAMRAAELRVEELGAAGGPSGAAAHGFSEERSPHYSARQYSARQYSARQSRERGNYFFSGQNSGSSAAASPSPARQQGFGFGQQPWDVAPSYSTAARTVSATASAPGSGRGRRPGSSSSSGRVRIAAEDFHAGSPRFAVAAAVSPVPGVASSGGSDGGGGSSSGPAAARRNRPISNLKSAPRGAYGLPLQLQNSGSGSSSTSTPIPPPGSERKDSATPVPPAGAGAAAAVAAGGGIASSSPRLRQGAPPPTPGRAAAMAAARAVGMDFGQLRNQEHSDALHLLMSSPRTRDTPATPKPAPGSGGGGGGSSSSSGSSGSGGKARAPNSGGAKPSAAAAAVTAPGGGGSGTFWSGGGGKTTSGGGSGSTGGGGSGSYTGVAGSGDGSPQAAAATPGAALQKGGTSVYGPEVVPSDPSASTATSTAISIPAAVSGASAGPFSALPASRMPLASVAEAGGKAAGSGIRSRASHLGLELLESDGGEGDEEDEDPEAMAELMSSLSASDASIDRSGSGGADAIGGNVGGGLLARPSSPVAGAVAAVAVGAGGSGGGSGGGELRPAAVPLTSITFFGKQDGYDAAAEAAGGGAAPVAPAAAPGHGQWQMRGGSFDSAAGSSGSSGRFASGSFTGSSGGFVAASGGFTGSASAFSPANASAGARRLPAMLGASALGQDVSGSGSSGSSRSASAKKMSMPSPSRSIRSLVGRAIRRPFRGGSRDSPVAAAAPALASASASAAAAAVQQRSQLPSSGPRMGQRAESDPLGMQRAEIGFMTVGGGSGSGDSGDIPHWSTGAPDATRSASPPAGWSPSALTTTAGAAAAAPAVTVVAVGGAPLPLPGAGSAAAEGTAVAMPAAAAAADAGMPLRRVTGQTAVTDLPSSG